MPPSRICRQHGRTVGVIAVDPSSPISGGAILGDRIRMTSALDDDGVFVRSLASRGYLGGLSPAAVSIIDALDGAGFDIVLLETVGTGQNEIDVAEVADIRVVVSAPGLGDDIQAMKSGLLEIADVIVVNKGDRPGVEQTMQQLIGALSIRATVAEKIPVLKTTALNGDGVPKLIETLDEIGRRVVKQGTLSRRRRRARYLIARAAADIVANRIKAGKKAASIALPMPSSPARSRRAKPRCVCSKTENLRASLGFLEPVAALEIDIRQHCRGHHQAEGPGIAEPPIEFGNILEIHSVD